MNYRKEHIIYTSIWLLLYISPLGSLYMRMSSNPDISFSWHEILNAWEFNTVWLVLMLIHNFLLLPILILKRRTWQYLMLASALLISAHSLLSLSAPQDHDSMIRTRGWR